MNDLVDIMMENGSVSQVDGGGKGIFDNTGRTAKKESTKCQTFGFCLDP